MKKSKQGVIGEFCWMFEPYGDLTHITVTDEDTIILEERDEKGETQAIEEIDLPAHLYLPFIDPGETVTAEEAAEMAEKYVVDDSPIQPLGMVGDPLTGWHELTPEIWEEFFEGFSEKDQKEQISDDDYEPCCAGRMKNVEEQREAEINYTPFIIGHIF